MSDDIFIDGDFNDGYEARIQRSKRRREAIKNRENDALSRQNTPNDMTPITPIECDFCGSTDNVELWPWRSVIVNACMKCAETWDAQAKEQRKKDEAKVVDIAANEPHKCSEVICVKCGKRWFGIRPIVTRLKELHCEQCGPGFVIETGEDLTEIESHDN